MPVPKFLKDLAVRAAEDVAKGGERQVAKRAARGAAKTGKELVADLWAKGLPPEARGAPSLAVRPAAKPVVRALPAPPKPLALPKPGPGLPEFAAKPRGGQWWSDREFVGANFSPENAAREVLPPGLTFSSDPQDIALREWWQRAVPKYIKSDFASPTDPLRDLADRGLLHIPNIGPNEWSAQAGGSFIEDPLQQLLLPKNPKGGMPGAGDDLRGETLAAMPWLAKSPITDNIYGVSRNSLSGLEFGHVADELRNAMNAEVHGIPADFAVRPESLARMSFPQAVERVGRINQWRAEQAAKAGLSNLESPAVQLFKEYPEDNPMGLRWAELRAPQFGPDNLPEGYSLRERPNDQGGTYFSLRDDFDGGREIGSGQTPEAAIRAGSSRIDDDSLSQALKYEGDTMGHCVGGYCDEVLSGRSRIFSLRDAKGEPHVTIETAPGRVNVMDPEVIPDDVMNRFIDEANATHGEQSGWGYARRNAEQWARENLSLPQDIVQIKGKQNRAPNPEYLPFVQDFVKSGQWGNIGDLGNTGLVKLPDGRYVTQDQWRQGIRRRLISENPVMPDARMNQIIDQEYPDPRALVPDNWDEYAPHFEGFARGGRVRRDLAAKPCSCDTSLAVR